MSILLEILDPRFLLSNSVYISLLIGFACPLAGVFLVLRRMVFMGVALPQISSTGIALALSAHVWWGHFDGTHGEEERKFAFLGSMVFALGAILWLALLERRGRGRSDGRIGAAYVVAGAVSIILVAKCPQAEQGWMNLFKGEIIAISATDLNITLGVLAAVIAALLIFKKEFLFVSYDPEMALVLKKRVAAWDIFLYLLIGLTISVAVLSVGPLISFGFLLVPPLIAHLFATGMRMLFVLSSVIGGVTALVGFAIAYRWDLPVGPTDVALLGAFYALAYTGKRIALWRRPAAPSPAH